MAAGRRDLGTFRAGGRVAVISAPGTAPRSWSVVWRRGVEEAGQEAVLVRTPRQRRPPMLKRGHSYRVRLSTTGAEVEADGSELSFAGEAEYEFWNEAVSRFRYLKGHSFACVWIPGIQGHCQPASSFEEWLRAHGRAAGVAAQPPISPRTWARYQTTLPWIHQQLEAGYGFRGGRPACENCGWFDFWAINVLRCYEDGQQLRFAFLEEPLHEQQPPFVCTARGWEGKYWVGIAQKVELEWTQDQMCIPVAPITLQGLLDADDQELRMVGNAVAVAGAPGTDLHRSLAVMLKRLRLAKRRRQLLLTLLRCLPVLPLGLGVLALLLASEGTQGSRGDALVVALVAPLTAWGSWRLQQAFSQHLSELFEKTDEEDADHFTRGLQQRMEARGGVEVGESTGLWEPQVGADGPDAQRPGQEAFALEMSSMSPDQGGTERPLVET